jgi:exodeoxyribonuclease V alpha subunit
MKPNLTRVSIQNVVAANPLGCIFQGKVVDPDHPGYGGRLKVRAWRSQLAADPVVGEVWDVEGQLVDTGWGPQLEASRAVRRVPEGALIRNWIASVLGDNGSTVADALWRSFGPRLSQVLQAGDVHRLSVAMSLNLPVLGPALAVSLVNAWRAMETEARLVAWLADHGIDDAVQARRIHGLLGAAALETLARNPWCLVPLAPWTEVDSFGLRLLAAAGTAAPDDHPNRLVGAVDSVVRDIISAGDTAIPERILRERLARKLSVVKGHRRIADAVALGIKHVAIVAGAPGTWRAPGCAAMEEAIASRFRRHAALAGDEDCLDDLAQQEFLRQEALGHGLHPEQRQAVREVLRRRFGILQGAGGTGKTHVARTICAIWERAGGNVLLAALSGKAAHRLAAATGRQARTLARVLRELDERDRLNADSAASRPVPCEARGPRDELAGLANIDGRTLVVIDESSMVDLATFHALIRRIPAEGRLLMIGDECQLPPIGFGLVFHKLVSDDAITSRLTHVHRQAEASNIPQVAAQVRKGGFPEVPRYQGRLDGISLIPARDRSDIASIVEEVALELGGLDRGELMLLTPTRHGAGGAFDLNRRFHERFHTGGPALNGALGEQFSVGDPVMYRRNDYRRGLFNGSVGQITDIDPRYGSVTASFDGEAYSLGRGDLANLGLAYAITCHRAQGSQARRVIVAVFRSRLIDPSWIYTAITRAESQVVIVGDRSAIDEAMARNWASSRRRVGLNWEEPVGGCSAMGTCD